MSNLDTFVDGLTGGGARANQYKIAIDRVGIPTRKFQFLCRQLRFLA